MRKMLFGLIVMLLPFTCIPSVSAIEYDYETDSYFIPLMDTYVQENQPKIRPYDQPFFLIGTDISNEKIEAYLYFSLGQIFEDNPYKYFLHLYSLDTSDEPEINLINCSNEWDEKTVAWNNKSSHGEIMVTSILETGHNSFEITEWVESRINDNYQMTICINRTQSIAGEYIDIQSSEKGYLKTMPYIEIQAGEYMEESIDNDDNNSNADIISGYSLIYLSLISLAAIILILKKMNK